MNDAIESFIQELLWHRETLRSILRDVDANTVSSNTIKFAKHTLNFVEAAPEGYKRFHEITLELNELILEINRKLGEKVINE